MNEVKLPIDFFYEIDKLPGWRIKKLMRYIRIYAMTGTVSGMPVKMYELFELAKESIDKERKMRERCKTNGKRGAKNRWNGKKIAKNGGAISQLWRGHSEDIAKNSGAIQQTLPDYKAEVQSILGADYD